MRVHALTLALPIAIAAMVVATPVMYGTRNGELPR